MDGETRTNFFLKDRQRALETFERRWKAQNLNIRRGDVVVKAGGLGDYQADGRELHSKNNFATVLRFALSYPSSPTPFASANSFSTTTASSVTFGRDHLKDLLSVSSWL